MPPKQELCRNYQRGSCQYGDRCKFVHAISQQPKATNPFGFGVQTGNSFQPTNQQQQPNPFGFGVQKNTQPRGGNDFGTKPNQFKPFENKWSRFSPINNSNASASRASENQPSSANHMCTDPESCKRIILEDLQKEKPLWSLTSYGHNKNGPCDISGDISYEELRALAYDDAKQGKNLQFIIERERSLQNTKLIEFQNLAQKPYKIASDAIPTTQSPFAAARLNTSVINNGVSPPVSSFGQLSTLPNTGSAAVPNFSFGQPSAFQSNNQSPGLFQTNSSSFKSSGAFGSQIQHQSAQSSSFGSASFINSAANASGNPFSTLANSSLMGNSENKLQSVSNLSSSTPAMGQSSTNNIAKAQPKIDDSVWSRAEWKWNAGEIPEEAPPDIYIH